MRLSISALVITYNEEANIRECLDSLSFLDEVFVVDSFSADRTVEICKRYEPAAHSSRAARLKVFQHKFEDFARQRNWALKKLPWSNEWVFVLDADERISPELRTELEDLFAYGQLDADFYYVKRRFIFLGRWLKHSTIYPFWLIRLFRHSEARYTRPVNEQVVIPGKPGYLKGDLIHKDRKGLHAWIEKHNRYSTMESKEYIKVNRGEGNPKRPSQEFQRPDLKVQRLKRLLICLPFRPFLRFLYTYVWRRGFLDGKPGFIYCMLQALQEFHINCKMYEMRLEGKR